MNSSVEELIFDGNTAEPDNKFKGTGCAADDKALRRLSDYRAKFPDSCREIIRLLFEPYYGAGFSYLKADMEGYAALASEIREINPQVRFVKTTRKETAANPPGVPEIAERIINGFASGENCPPYDISSAVYAEQPWSGYYKPLTGLWCAAHITHFAGSDWTRVRSFCGKNRCAFMGPEGDYTLLFANNTDDMLYYNVFVINTDKADSELYCVESSGLGREERSDSESFRVIDKIIPARSKSGQFYRIDVKPHSVLTCTTLSVDSVDGTGSVEASPYESSCLELPYYDSFDNAAELSAAGVKAPVYSVGEHGSFEVISCGERELLVQTALNGEHEPVIIIGDENWSSYSVKTEVMFDGAAEDNYAGVGLRYSDDGYTFKVFPDGRWELSDCGGLLESGIGEELNISVWNAVKITARYRKIRCFINKTAVCEHTLSGASLTSGYAALLSGFYDNRFRNLMVSPVIGVPFCRVVNGCFSGFVEYGDGWTRETNHVFTDTKAEFEFDFFSQSISLIGCAEELRMKAEIDGRIVTAGGCINGGTSERAFWSESGLTPEAHHIKVTVLSGRLRLYGIVTDDLKTYDKPQTIVLQKRESSSKAKIKKSTLFIGAGLAAAGTGAIVLNKIFKKKKK